MNGEINFKSKLRHGTKFDFFIGLKSKKDDKGLSCNENLKLQDKIIGIVLHSKDLILNLY